MKKEEDSPCFDTIIIALAQTKADDLTNNGVPGSELPLIDSPSPEAVELTPLSLVNGLQLTVSDAYSDELTTFTATCHRIGFAYIVKIGLERILLRIDGFN